LRADAPVDAKASNARRPFLHFSDRQANFLKDSDWLKREILIDPKGKDSRAVVRARVRAHVAS
jgi:proline racemase